MTAVDPPPYSPSAEEEEEFNKVLAEARKEEAKVGLTLNGKNVVWVPQEGSQVDFLSCPLFEGLYHGTRGGGKTDTLLWDYGQDVGKGWGSNWAGILFRPTYPQLADVQAKSEKWFRQVFPDAKYNRAHMKWEWPTGERLLFRHMLRPQDYWNYHGHEYPWIAFEEITNWPLPDCYIAMISCSRSTVPDMPRKMRSTTNPYGPGHNWVKDRFKLDGKWWETIVQPEPKNAEGETEPARFAIHSHIRENKLLLAAQPDYPKMIISSSTSPAMKDAWLNGSWEIVAGGMFGDVWDSKYNIVPVFSIPYSWRIDRSFDWGSSKPFSVGWWAESDGTDVNIPGRGWCSTVKGDLFRIKEWYGWSGKPNKGIHMLATEVTKGIVSRELGWGLRESNGFEEIRSRVHDGPADSAIYKMENGVSVGVDMQKKVRLDGVLCEGIYWDHADKQPGSRIAGWEAVRTRMKSAHPNKNGEPRENPGLFIMENCAQFIRTVPVLPRDEKNMDDVDTDAEDHIGDEVRYRVRASMNQSGSATHTGLF